MAETAKTLIYGVKSYSNFSGVELPEVGAQSETFTAPLLRIGTSSSQVTIGTADVGLIGIESVSALTTGNVVSMRVAQEMSAAASANTIEVLQAVLTTEVQVGNWANAVLAKVDFSAAAARVTGLAGAVCAEIDMPDAAGIASGGYYCFEGEMNFRTSTTIGGGTKAGFFVLNLWGAGAGDFDDNGVLFEITGVTSGSGDFFYDNTANAADAFLKCRVNGDVYYLALSDDQSWA